MVEGGHPVSGDCTPEWLASDECMCLQDYFGGMLPSPLTLFQCLVFDDTFELVRPVLFVSLWYGCVLLGYIVFLGITVLNMLIGLTCDVISEIGDEEKAKLLKDQVADAFLKCDVDADGVCSREEMSSVVEDLRKLGSRHPSSDPRSK